MHTGIYTAVFRLRGVLVCVLTFYNQRNKTFENIRTGDFHNTLLRLDVKPGRFADSGRYVTDREGRQSIAGVRKS